MDSETEWWDITDWLAKAFYSLVVEHLAKGGNCFGMSLEAIYSKKDRALLLLSTMTTVTGACAVSGGVRGPFWILYLPNVLFAATTMRQWQSAALGGVAGAGVVVSSAIAHTLDPSTAAWFVLVVPVFPAIAWFNGTLASSVWAMTAAPVAACTSASACQWSQCRWVVTIRLSGRPPSSSSSLGASLAASISTSSPVCVHWSR